MVIMSGDGINKAGVLGHIQHVYMVMLIICGTAVK